MPLSIVEREMKAAGQERANIIGPAVQFGWVLVLVNFCFQSVCNCVV